MSTQTFEQQVLNEIVAVAGDPNVTLEEISERLKPLYDQAEAVDDQRGMILISDAWTRIEALHGAASTAVSLAAAAQQVASEMQAQRDEALEQHAKLRKAVQEMDDSDPDVAELKEAAFEAAEEGFTDAIYYGGSYYSNDPAEDIANSLEGVHERPVDYGTAQTFFDILCSGELDSIKDEHVRDQMQAELIRFMDEFVERYQTVIRSQDLNRE